MSFRIFNSAYNKYIRLKKLCKNIGFKQFLKILFYKRHEEILLEADLNKQLTLSKKNTLTIQSIEKKHQDILLDLYSKSNRFDMYPKSRINRYFVSDCNCFIALENNKFIGHLWWGTNKMDFKYCDPGLKYFKDTNNLKDYDIVIIDFFIIPEARGSGTVLEFLSKVWIALSKLGYKRCFGLVLPENKAAWWTYKLLGFSDFKKIVVNRIFNYIVVIKKKIYLSPPYLNW